MKNLRKFLVFLFASIAIFFVFDFTYNNIVFASISITEIMYDLDTGSDTGREWVEVLNDGNDAVVITEYKLFEANTNHGITESFGGASINSNEYVIIADNPDKFRIDYPDYSGKLFDSSFSLLNTGENLALKDKDLNIIDSITYNSEMGAGGDGSSLQKINDNWISALPTPGVINDNTIIPPDDEEETSTTTATTTATTTSTVTTDSSNGTSITYSVHYNQEELSDYEEPTNIFEVSAGRERFGYAGSPMSFEAKYKVSTDLNNRIPNYIWSFGDGSGASDGKIIHAYKYPGEYNVVLNANLGGINSIARTKVKVSAPNLSLLVLNDGAVEISNKGTSEINLYGWTLQSKNQIYAFPLDTIISANKSIIFPGEFLRIITVGSEVFLVDASNKVITQTGANFSVSDPNKVITVAEFEKFALEYKKLTHINSPVSTATINSNVISVPNNQTIVNLEPSIPLTASVASVVISATNSDARRNNIEDSVLTEAPARGFWSKFFHPIRTIKEAFYK